MTGFDAVTVIDHHDPASLDLVICSNHVCFNYSLYASLMSLTTNASCYPTLCLHFNANTQETLIDRFFCKSFQWQGVKRVVASWP